MTPVFRILISILFALSVLIPSGLSLNVSSAEETNSTLDTFAANGINMDGGGNLSETRQTCNTITSRISGSTDDAEQRISNSLVYLANTTLQMYRNFNGSNSLTYWGLRFINVEIPESATIQSATIEFQAAAAGTSLAYHTFYGQLSSNPTTFTVTNNDIWARTRTSSNVLWTIDPWVLGEYYSTPDLSTIIQEIVNLDTWQANNSLVIVGQSSGTRNRSVVSYDGSATVAPLLTVTYCIEDTTHTIGDLVWEDEGDGIQQAGEPGIANVPVKLFNSTEVEVDQVLSDANGRFAFNNVSAGSYYIHFGLPDNYSYTLKEQGSDPALDSNVDPSTGRTGVFTWQNSASDLDLDAGLIRRYVTKSDRTVEPASDPLPTCCESYLVSQTVSASAPAEGITTPATLLRLSDSVADEFMIVPDSDTGCTSSDISEDGKTLTCNWDAQSIDTPTIITYQIRKASAVSIASSGTYATHEGGSLLYSDQLGRSVSLNYGAGSTTAALSGADMCQGNIEIEKTLLSGDVSAGDTVVFRLEVSNLSTFPISGFTIVDQLDPLLSFVSAQPDVCEYGGEVGTGYGGTITCTVSAVIADQQTFTVDLTTLFMPGSEEFFGENTAYVSCSWCIVDSDSDSSVSPTAINGVINFAVRVEQDVVISWRTVDETLIRRFTLFRQGRGTDKLMIYETSADYSHQVLGSSYSFTDTSHIPGELYQYSLEVLWMDGTRTVLMSNEITAPHKLYFPLLINLMNSN